MRCNSKKSIMSEVVAHNRNDPPLLLALRYDPALPIDDDARAIIIRDLSRTSRRFLPAVRWMSLVMVFLIRTLKAVLPFQFRWHDGIDVLCLWFVRRFLSADAGELLARHFVVETNLLAFIAKNAGLPAAMPTLRPLSLAELGSHHAVMQHDINAYNLVIDVGMAGVDVHRARASLDVSMLQVPPIDAERGRHRWLEIDIETSLYLMNIPFCLFTTQAEYERGVNSFQLDESFMTMLANLTGDATYRTWTPTKFSTWISVARDVPKELYLHATLCEYAHTHLRRTQRLST
jgi:hypothetical protein